VLVVLSAFSVFCMSSAEPTDSLANTTAALAAARAEAAAAAAAAKQAVALAEATAIKVQAAQELVAEKSHIAPTLQVFPSHHDTMVSNIYTVPLQRQLIPVMKNGRIVANKTAFFGKVLAGNPRQVFTVVMDTGSGHLILPSTACNSETCMKHSRYNRSASTSAIDIEADGTRIRSTASERDQVAIAFGTGEVLGEFVEEDVCLGSDSTQCVNMRMVVATSMTPDPFGAFAFDGVLGIGLDSLALNSRFSFFGEMSAQHPTMQPYFAVFLARNDDEESSISFGGFEPSFASSEIEWVAADMQHLGYWQVRLKSVRIGDVELEMCSDGTCRAILDTGTSLLGVPRQATRLVTRLLARPAPEDPSASCLNTPGKALTFELENTVVSMGVEDYSQSAAVNIEVPGKPSRLICKSLLMPVDIHSPAGSKVFIFGEPFLRKYYTVYDLAQKRIGFAVARQGRLSSLGSSITI
jgi:saccharopepsin